MAYKRLGRETYTFQARTETGWKQLGTRTPSRALASRIEGMWETLAVEHRAWDLLGRVLSGALSIGQLYDAWVASRFDVAATRRRLDDVDLEPIVSEWHGVYARTVLADSAEHALAHVPRLLPEGQRRLASTVTPAWLTSQLYAYLGKRNTLRKVHSSWTVFFAFLVKPKGIYATNPMRDVDRPGVERSPIRFYELDTVERIVAWQPTEERRALFALLYGTGIEISTALALTRADVWQERKEIRAAGTKVHSRDRVARVADWAWPLVWEHCRNALPAARLFPSSWSRYTVSDWHRQAVGAGTKRRDGNVAVQGLALPQRYPLHCARDHWAVRAARAGTPTAVIQQQLGHSSPLLTLSKYGRFLPSVADRARWEAAATQYEAERREAR